MDEIDTRQQAELDQLHAAAKENKNTDRWQWIILLSFALGLTFYVSMILTSALNIQGHTIERLTDQCGK